MDHSEFGELIASESYQFLRSDGSWGPVEARVGRPRPVDAETWVCPCELLGYDGRYADIRGATSMQALSLALTMIRRQLESHIERGGKIYFDDRVDMVDFDYLAATFGGLGRSC